MGIGGDLIFSSIIRNLRLQSYKPIVVASTPELTDLLRGKLYNRAVTHELNPVFQLNPRVVFPESKKKGMVSQFIDSGFKKILEKLGFYPSYEKFIFWLGTNLKRSHYIYLDMELLSYGEKTLQDRVIWKTGGHAVDIGLKNYGMQSLDHRCELFLSTQEKNSITTLKQKLGLDAKSYLVLEPNTNKDWFGDLRSWPWENWLALIEKLQKNLPSGIELVQVGVEGSTALPNIKNISGKNSVRETAAIIRDAKLFIGTEGGLMHLANAMETPSVILWGGLTLPEFTGYKEYQTVICKYVECAPCGLRGNCPHQKKCMTSITVDEVFAAITSELKK